MLKDFGIKGCVFDFDGTIVSSEHIHMQAFEHMARSLGMVLPAGFLEGVVGFSDSESVAKLVQMWNFKFTADEILERKADFYRSESQEACELIPGVVGVLQSLAKQVPLALATNSWSADVEPILELYDLRKYFKGIHTFDTIESAKPHPEIYLKAAKTLGHPPTDCLAFEDSVAGVTAVRAAGLRLISVGTMYGPNKLGPSWRHIHHFEDELLNDLV